MQHTHTYMGMDQYLLIPFLGGWTSIYQLFWCSPGVQGFDTLPHSAKLPYGFTSSAKLWCVVQGLCSFFVAWDAAQVDTLSPGIARYMLNIYFLKMQSATSLLVEKH